MTTLSEQQRLRINDPLEDIAEGQEVASGRGAGEGVLSILAGNPWGTDGQRKACNYWGSALRPPRQLSKIQRGCAWLAGRLEGAQRLMTPMGPTWMHVVLSRERGRGVGELYV